MTLLAEHPAVLHGHPEHHEGPTGVLKWLTSTDHKVIGLSYMITSLVIFFIAGGMAILLRVQLASPHSSLLSLQQYNELFTMHGSLMLYLFAGPFAFGGLANYIIPLQVGAPDMAFPRLNALSYWLYLGGTITMHMDSSLRVARRPSRGSPTHRCRAQSTHRGPARTCSSWPSCSRGSPQCSPGST